MNFLAHLYLSGDSQPILVGNFIGDFVKGSQINNFDQEIVKGVLIHRAIDSYTDQHPVVKQSKARLAPTYRHYAGVIVDVYYDHFLAANWEKYHDLPLLQYSSDCYSLLLKYEDILPERVKHMLGYMIPQNWLYSYRKVEGIGEALSGLSRRTKFESGMEFAVNDLKEHYSEFEKEFTDFFAELVDYVQNLDISEKD